MQIEQKYFTMTHKKIISSIQKKKQPEKIPLTIFFRYEEASKENIINQEHNISPFLGDDKIVSNIFHIPITLSERF